MGNIIEEIIDRYKKGQLKETLVGDGEYFITHSTYAKSHDLLLVTYTLLEFAHKEDKVHSFSEKSHSCLLELSKTNQPVCADALLAYTINAIDSNMYLDIDLYDVYESLKENVDEHKVDDTRLVNCDLLNEIEKKLLKIRRKRGRPDIGQNKLIPNRGH